MLREAENRLANFCEDIASQEGVEISQKSLARFEPVEFNQQLVDQVFATAQSLGYSTKRMTSGAGHDAQMLSRVCPAAMIFVPSKDGISHNVKEFTEKKHIQAGANVLLQVVLKNSEEIL